MASQGEETQKQAFFPGIVSLGAAEAMRLLSVITRSSPHRIAASSPYHYE